jgi:hypothetical protein
VKAQVFYQLNREQATLEIAAVGDASDTSGEYQSSTSFQESKQIK